MGPRPGHANGWDKVAHEVENPSVAIIPAAAASSRRKQLILLCCEDLRPIACALEDALRERGWDVRVELGADAKPWVQKAPVARPSVRVLCVPGRVDRDLARQLRAAFRPDPDADLHILGVDDSPGLVHEIERLAGVRTPGRRPLAAAPRLAHDTQVEQAVRRDRGVRVSVLAAVATLAVTLGGASLVDHAARAPELRPTGIASSLLAITPSRPADLDADLHAHRTHAPVLAAMAPVALDEPAWDDDDVEVVLLDDPAPEEPRELDAPITTPGSPGRVGVLVSPLAAPASTTPVTLAASDAITDVPSTTVERLTVTTSLPTPSGSPILAGVAIGDAPARTLPPGFLPVAGMTVAPAVTTIDPFVDGDVGSHDALVTIDPFGASPDAAAP